MIRPVLAKPLILFELYLDQSLRSPEPIVSPNNIKANQIDFCHYFIDSFVSKFYRFLFVGEEFLQLVFYCAKRNTRIVNFSLLVFF